MFEILLFITNSGVKLLKRVTHQYTINLDPTKKVKKSHKVNKHVEGSARGERGRGG